MKKKFAIGAIFAVGIIFLVVYQFRNKQEKDVLVLSGNVEVTEINMGFKSAGRIIKLSVKEGEKIKQGEELAVIDRAELESQAEQNRAYLSETLTRLGELKTGARPQEIAQARANVDSAKAEFSKAEKDYERFRALYQKGTIAAQQLDNAQKIYESAFARHKNAVETLSLVREGPRSEVIKAAGERVRQAKAALSISEERLKDAVIYAPVSGVILQKVRELGETVAPGTAVYTIGDLENPWIKVYVKEDKLGLVTLGQKAEVTTDSYPGKKYEGKVSYISSEAEFTPKNVQTKEERVKLVFGVKVSVKNTNDELKPGLPADVKILLKQ